MALPACLRLLLLRLDDGPALQVDASTLPSVVAALLPSWHSDLTSLLLACDAAPLVLRPIYAMPVGTRWACRGQTTLIGDAAHVMSPFAGAGANLALQDGAALGLTLVAQRAMAGFEEDMFRRAFESAARSAANLELFMSPEAGAAGRVAAFFEKVMGRGPEQDPLVA